MGGIITAVCNLGSSFMNWITGRSQLHNAPDVKLAAIKQKEQAAKDNTAAALASGDLDQIRKEHAE